MNFDFLRRRVYSASRFAKRGLANPRFDTSDIAQEVVLQFVKEVAVNDLDTQELVSDCYIRTVCSGTANRMLRDNLAECRSLNKETSIDSVEPAEGRQLDPAHAVQDREQIVVLIRSLARLHRLEREIVYRRLFDQMSFVEISKGLEHPYHVVRRTYEKAIERLKRMLV